MKVTCELLGSSFELPAAPRRVVSLVSAATETVAELGGRELLVGVSPYCSRYVAGLSAPVVGDYLRADVAALRALAPDLVLFTSGVQLPLAQIPTGTTNFVARAMLIPMNVRSALDVIDKGKPMPFDIGYLPEHDRHFIFVAGAGYDSTLIHETPPDLKRG